MGQVCGETSKRSHSLRHIFGPLTPVVAGLEDLARTNELAKANSHVSRPFSFCPRGPQPIRIPRRCLLSVYPGNLNFWRPVVGPAWNAGDTGTQGPKSISSISGLFLFSRRDQVSLVNRSNRLKTEEICEVIGARALDLAEIESLRDDWLALIAVSREDNGMVRDARRIENIDCLRHGLWEAILFGACLECLVVL